MAIAHTLNRDFFTYTSDDGNNYSLATTVENGTVNGATGTPSPIYAKYPRAWRARYVFGVTPAGIRTKVVILSATSPLWTGATTTFMKDGTTYTILGKIGENRGNRGQ